MNPAEPLFGFAVVAGLGLLAWSADRFVTGATGLARSFGVSPIIGLTIVAFGTSAPEMLVSAMAAWQGNSGIAIGNAVGSNIANMALVLGVAALIAPLSAWPLPSTSWPEGAHFGAWQYPALGRRGAGGGVRRLRYGFFLAPYQHARHENPAGGDR